MSMSVAYKRIIVAGTMRAEIARLLPFARVLARAWDTRLLVLGLVSVPPEEKSLVAGTRPAQNLRRELQALARGTEARVVVRVAHHAWREVLGAVEDPARDLLLIHWASEPPVDLLRDLPCDVVIMNGELPAKLERILLPIRGGPYAPLALQVARAFAATRRAGISLLHAAPSEQVKEQSYRDFLSHLRALPEITRWIIPRGDAARAVIRYGKEHQLLVMGAAMQPQPGDPPIGATAMRVTRRLAAHCPTLIVKKRGEATVGVDHTITVTVDKWFAENTFHAHEFRDIAQLVELKKRQGLSISLGLPALNEAKTIGKIITTLRAALMERYPLLDEIVVIDSDSTDDTVAIAKGLGVPVHRHSQILPAYGSNVGKGEALWKSLYVLRGDLIAWIDTDIVNIHPRFVYGILGPLLKEPHLMYVKGFYQRPLRLGRKLQARGGGRVTELMARPLLNLFYPDLSGMIQPLAGEYAGRRTALARVPFFSGYGVETGLLIDIFETFGLSAIAQVDLNKRVHRNQSLLALSKMAFAIAQVVLQRVGEKRAAQLLAEETQSLKLIRYDDKHFRLDVHGIRDEMRPPMVEIPEYRARFGVTTPVRHQARR